MRVTLRHLSKHFGEVKAVDDLSLEIGEGEFVALLGPSGCGKTTTLLTIAGFYQPTSGDIYFDDRRVNDLPPRERNIGMVFQSYALYPHMNAFDNIFFPLKLKGISRRKGEAKVWEVARLLQIEDLLDRKPGELSGGQQQRVALARALVKEPGLLLLDEPLSNLDAKLRITMRAELKRLQKALGITTIFVTHDQVEAMTMADRIAVLNQGRLQQVGSPKELYDLPANLFVAGFIGTPPMNFIEGSLLYSRGKAFLVNEFLRLPLPNGAQKALAHPVSDRIVLGIRPEDLTIGLKDEREGEGIEAELYVLEPLGRDNLVTLKVGELTLKAFAPPTFQADAGSRVWVKFDWDKIHLFDKETEQRLQYREEVAVWRSPASG
jgi:ABC-type sugar transport system ATPase subunit